MRKTSKPVFFIISVLILALTAVTFLGISYWNGDIKETIIKSANDIRWGIDIRGGVDVTFSPPADYDATDEEMQAARAIIEVRLIGQNITDYELYVDSNKDRIILRFPWKSGEADFNAEAAIRELGETAMLTFREGAEYDDVTGAPTGVTAEKIILQGTDVENAQVMISQGGTGAPPAGEPIVSLRLSDAGAAKFSEATGRLIGGVISIWMDDTMISYPQVNAQIPDGEAVIQGGFTSEEALDLANKINAGALPFKLQTENYSTISATLGENARDAMVLAGVIAFALVCVFMLAFYRVPGFVACFTLLGQITLIIASTTGFFGGLNSFTLTLPGIAGIVLSIGFGVDATVITAERIKEEIQLGKTIDGAIENGYKRAFSAILDGNVTVIIVAVILMGAFGPPDSLLGSIFSKIFFMFGPATAGNIYSFGYTLLMGVIFNLIMGVGVARLMLRSLSKFKLMRKPALYGGHSAESGKTNRMFHIRFSENIRKYAVVSGALIAVIIAGMFAFGVQLDIQFRGGSIITYAYDGEVDAARFSDIVAENLPLASVQQSVDVATGSPTAVVSLAGNESVSADALASVTEKLAAEFPSSNVRSLEISNVSPTIGSEFLAKCLAALALAVVLMLVYVAIRFKKIGGLSAGAMGVVALAHDCLIVFGVFVLFRIPINMNFIAVILTIIGYSLNDTIVIYDRIRENKRIYGAKLTPRELVDLSVNQTLVRCINTSVTTTISMVVVTVVAMLFNVDSIFSFSFPLILGLISGTYSSVCLASPLWVRWQERKLSQKGK